MKQQESEQRRRGRPSNKSKRDKKIKKVIVLDTSSSEETMNYIPLLDRSVSTFANSSKMLAGMKELRVKIQDLANIPGALSSRHMTYLSARRFEAKEQSAQLKRGRVRKKEMRRKAKVKPVSKAITISSDSTDAVQVLNLTTLKKSLVKDSSKSKERPQNIEEKCGRSVSPLSFGQRPSLEVPSWQINKRNDIDEKPISISESSISSADRVSTTTTKQKLQVGKHSFVVDLDESSRRQPQRNCRKRQRGNPDASIERRRKQQLDKDSVNGKSGLPERPVVDRVNSPKATWNDATRGNKLTAAVDDSAGKASIAPVDEIVAPASEIIAPINNIVAPLNEIMELIKESIASGKESIASDHRVVDKASVVDEPDKASAINDKNKASAVDNASKTVDFLPMVNGDLRNEDFSSFQPFLESTTDVKMIRLETTENEQLTLFSAPDNGADHALDKDQCSLASIVEAIDNDLAGGNQPIGLPIGGIDTAEIMGSLPDTSMPSNEGNQPEHVERRQNASFKIQESFDAPPMNGELAPILGNGNGSFEGNENRKRPAILEDDIFPKGTIDIPTLSLQTIRANRKRKKLNQPACGTPASSVDDNRNFTDSIEITMSHDEKLSDCVNEWEIEAALNEKCVNNNSHAPAKDGPICEDALNNNRGTTVMNKNEINSEKQEINAIENSGKPVISLIDEDLSKEYNALKCLVDMAPDALDKAIANGEAASDLESFDDHQINEALEKFTAEVVMNSSKSSIPRETVDGKTKPVEPLTIQNLDKFNSRTGPVEDVSKSTSMKRRETIDTDASSQESARLRKRKWVMANREKPASSPAKSGTIKLNRNNWSTGSQDSRKKSREVEHPIDCRAEPEEPVAKIAKNEDIQNDNKTPDIAEAAAVINDITKALISPIKNVQGCGNEVGAILPSFGSSNLTTSTPTKEGVTPDVVVATDESSGSSSSGSSSASSSSSSSSSSTSSDKDSSNQSDEEDISSNVEIVEDGEAAPVKNSEAPCQSDSGSKKSALKTLHAIEERTLALFGAEPESVETEKLGSLIDGCDDAEKSDSDESDCISLDTESLCMSRCASPELEVCAKRSITQNQQKRGNVRSRLGPRLVQNQSNAATAPTNNSKLAECSPPAVTSSNLGCESAANNAVAVEPAPNSAPGRLVTSNIIQVCPKATAPVVPDPTAAYHRKVEHLFRGHCWSWLKFEGCRKFPKCRYLHAVHPELQYHLAGMMNTRAIILYAISKEYRHFIDIIYEHIIPLMSLRQIVQFGIDVRGSNTLDHKQFVKIIEALKVHNLTLVEVVGLFDSMLSNSDVQYAMVIIESFYNMADLGTYWETLKKLLIKFADAELPIHVVTAVLKECVNIHRNKTHVDDVHDSFVAKLTSETRLALGGDLLKTFYDLRYSHVVTETENPPDEAAKKSNWTCSIASPDSSRESVDFPLAALLADRPSTSSALAGQPQATRETSKPPSASQSDDASTSGSGSYTLKQLDKLAPPKSAYDLWKFHLDLQGVQQGLLHNDYDHVINILTQLQKDPNRLPHIAGFYNILCKEIMSSRHHLEEIVRRTVQSGATDELRRFVYDLGVYVLTTLADTGAWVLAYQLLKTFKVYGQYNTCAFALLSAEIYIANHRPLKALAILKQTRLIFTNTRCWNQMWCSNDEPLRVSVIELLLSSLCDGYAEHALSLLDFILSDQCSSSKPINISRYIDRVASMLLKENLTNAIVDLGRLIVQNNLLVSSRVFRAVINRIIHSEQFLAKQLHRYATWLGIYNMPKISGVTHMIVNIDWTEEEMYLMFSALLHDLYINIGHAVDRLRPRQLAVYLILERLPTERQLLKDESGPPLTNAEIKKRRAVVKSVFERFDPKIRVIQRLQGKLCKIQSESLVNYLKAGHFKC